MTFVNLAKANSPLTTLGNTNNEEQAANFKKQTSEFTYWSIIAFIVSILDHQVQKRNNQKYAIKELASAKSQLKTKSNSYFRDFSMENYSDGVSLTIPIVAPHKIFLESFLITYDCQMPHLNNTHKGPRRISQEIWLPPKRVWNLHKKETRVILRSYI